MCFHALCLHCSTLTSVARANRGGGCSAANCWHTASTDGWSVNAPGPASITLHRVTLYVRSLDHKDAPL